MTIKFNLLEDGTSFTAEEYNIRFQEVFTGLNAIRPDSVGLGAFRHNHLPSFVGPARYAESELSVTAGMRNRVDKGFDAGETSCITITAVSGTASDGMGDTDDILSCMTAADFPSFRIGHEYPDRVGAVLLMGNFLVREWKLQTGTTSYTDLNEDCLAVQAAFKLEYVNTSGATVTKILERSIRALSPRLSISKEIMSSGIKAGDDSTVLASTDGDFDDNAVAGSYARITLAESSAAIDLETRYPALWTALNSTDDDDDLIFSWAEGFGPAGTTTFPSVGEFSTGLRVDKSATLALHAAGTKNVIKIQADDVPDDSLTAWNSVSASSLWLIVEPKTAGAPMYQDTRTEQDLVLRSVLLPEDLDGGTLQKVTIVANQVGSMVEEGKFKVLVTKGIVTALPLHVKRET
jgi:hypothetical protein|tara:strand:- start:1116 stop:2333 length:1218 start_codon:yes stop_codon:yes gene_type:complete